jgi:hypothetical protein
MKHLGLLSMSAALLLVGCTAAQLRAIAEAAPQMIEAGYKSYEIVKKYRGGEDPFGGKKSFIGPDIDGTGQTYLVDANDDGKFGEGDWVFVDEDYDGYLDVKTDYDGTILWTRDKSKPKAKEPQVEPGRRKAETKPEEKKPEEKTAKTEEKTAKTEEAPKKTE